MRKTRYELRLDPDLHAKARALADAAGVSMNQLLEGVVAWAVQHGHPGRPILREDHPVIDSAEGPAVWFGTDGRDPEDDLPGEVVFVLDFSPARAVRTGPDLLPRDRQP
jgi:HicB family.